MAKRTVGSVTGATTAGGTLGAALAQVIVHIWPYLEPVSAAVTVILTAILALVGGYLVPPKGPNETVIIEDLTSEVLDREPPAEVRVSDGSGPSGV